MTSPDGITWTARAVEANPWLAVTYGNSLFVAVAASGANRVMTSPDGITWTPRAAAEANEWQSVTYGNGLFVATAYNGTNRVMTSPDGTNWTARAAAEANNWYSVTYGNSLFVAVSLDGANRVMTSPDATTWTPQTAAEANNWYSVTYGNSLFVAVASSGANRVMTSPDGITWTPRSAAEANEWVGVTYGNGLFVAVTWDGANRVMTSPDATTWTPQTAAEANEWNAVTYGNGLFVAVASTGANRVMTSGALLSPPGVSDFCNTTGSIWMAPFADVGVLSPVAADVGCLYHSGVVLDDGSNLYRPDDVTTRAEMVTFAARTLGPVRGLCPSRVPPFTDMDSASPIAGELACMYGLGVVRGRTGTTFDPDTAVTRGEAAAIISRFYQAVSSPRWSAACSAAANPFDDTTGHWSEPNITCVNALGLITEATTGAFSPEATVTRAETATMWKKTLVSLS
jgi:hypothetical protein